MSKASLIQLSKYVKVIAPLFAGNKNRRLIHLKSREIRNQLLDWVLKNTSPEVALQFQQPTWGKYVYFTQDTDLIRAIKTVFNLLYQIHIANSLDKSHSRHQHWPLFEIMELNRSRALLTSIFHEDDWRDILSVFNTYWQGCEKLFAPTQPEVKLPEESPDNIQQQLAELEANFQVRIESDVKIHDDYADKFMEKVEHLSELSKNYWQSDNSWKRIWYLIEICRNNPVGDILDEQSGVIRKLADLITNLLIYLDYIDARLGTSYASRFSQQLAARLDPQSPSRVVKGLRSQLRISHGCVAVTVRLARLRTRSEQLEAAIAKETVPAVVNQFYEICLRLAAGEKLWAETLENEAEIINYLTSAQLLPQKMSVDRFVRLTRHMLQIGDGELPQSYKEDLFHFVDQFGRKANRVHGMCATQKNLRDLSLQLETTPPTPGSSPDIIKFRKQLHQAFAQTIIAIGNFQEKLPSEFAEFSRQLTAMRLNLQKLQALPLDSKEELTPEQQQEFISKYLRLQGIYTRLSGNIPLACRKFLQGSMQSISTVMQCWLQASPPMGEVYQQVEDRTKKAHDHTLEWALAAICDSSSALTVGLKQLNVIPAAETTFFQSVIRTVSSVTSAMVGASPAVEEQVREDYLHFLETLGENIRKLAELLASGASTEERLPLINSLAATIFDLRRLARKSPLKSYPILKNLWEKLDSDIQYLRERDVEFRRAIAGDEVIIEDERWCARLELGIKAPELTTPAPGQILETLHGVIGTIHGKIMETISNQSKDSSYSKEVQDFTDGYYFQALYQEEWEKYEFNDAETTETYTLKSFLNLLYQLHQATRADISGWSVSKFIPGAEWAIRLSKIPLQEITKLLEELPAFLANSGIGDLAQEVLALVKALVSGIPGYDEGVNGIDLADLAANVSSPTATPVHALMHSGVVRDNDATQVIKIVDNVGKMVPRIININKIKNEENQAAPSGLAEAKPYIRLGSDSWQSKLVNFGKNLGVFFWNNLGRHIVNLRRVRKLNEYRAVAAHAIDIVKAPNPEELVVKEALTETSQQIRRGLIRLDTAAALSGLRETEALLQEVTSQVISQANSADAATKTRQFNLEWRIIGNEPFLLDRMKAQGQQIAEMEDNIDKLREKVPDVISQFISVMNLHSSSDEVLENLRRNRETIIKFLERYAQEKTDQRQQIINLLENRNAERVKNLRESGEKADKVLKFSKELSVQVGKVNNALKGLSAINGSSPDKLFESVILRCQNRQLFLNLPLLDNFHGFSEELAKYIGTHERTIRSKEQQLKNLKKAFAKKQIILEDHLRHRLETLCPKVPYLKNLNKNANNLKKFESDFQNLGKIYLASQMDLDCINNNFLRIRVYQLCNTVRQLKNISPESNFVATAIMQCERQSFTEALQDSIVRLGVSSSPQLQQFYALLPALEASGTQRPGLAKMIVTIAEKHPDLNRPLRNWLILFPELNRAVEEVGLREKPALVDNSMRFLYRQDQVSAPSEEKHHQVTLSW